MSSAQSETHSPDLIELERCALNESFAATGHGWFWDIATHASLRRVGDVKQQLDEYGCRIGELLSHQQLVHLEEEVSRRLADLILSSEQPDHAWVA